MYWLLKMVWNSLMLCDDNTEALKSYENINKVFFESLENTRSGIPLS